MPLIVAVVELGQPIDRHPLLVSGASQFGRFLIRRRDELQ
ncbi:hypothetical protein Fuma_04570 [Fuerstiella marisgermanici]|uniref:Uncharacterized protein n=1 Tax=Fuerstiella marisgermanici TaxID=1891926 RepID=A0A1P8WLI0_9PLAN|nr:hypothetical protein Fuma_04570 [Fuerstiella marisgermanici]